MKHLPGLPLCTAVSRKRAHSLVKCRNSRKSAHLPLCQTCKVLCPWALFHETTVFAITARPSLTFLEGERWSGLIDSYCLQKRTLYIFQSSPLSFEKMISAKYLGELVRLALQKLVKSGQLFGGKSSAMFARIGAFESSYIYIIEGRFVMMTGTYPPSQIFTISLYIPLHTCMYARMHAHTHAHTHACTHARTHIHMHTCTYAHMHARMYACTHTHTHTHTHIHTQIVTPNNARSC